MKKVLLQDHQVNNMLLFLDRVTFAGIKEAQAALEIVIALRGAQEDVPQVVQSSPEKPVARELPALTEEVTNVG